MPASQKNTGASAATNSGHRPKQASSGNVVAMPTAQKKALGAQMNLINQATNTARQPQHKVLKSCVDKVCACQRERVGTDWRDLGYGREGSASGACPWPVLLACWGLKAYWWLNHAS